MKDRIILLIKAKNLTAAQFADAIGVQKSSISHILSGRNNASLDFIQKILACYPEVNMEWLMFGRGPIFKSPGIVQNINSDEHLTQVQPPVLPHVDLFSELNPGKDRDFRKENDFNPELNSVQNPEIIEKKNVAILQQQEKKQSDSFSSAEKPENKILSSGYHNPQTKTIVKIVEFYSDNTYREYFPG